MLIWLIVSYGALFLALLGSAGYVSLFIDDPSRRADAYKVLKLLSGIAAGSGGTGGIVALLVNLHKAGAL